MTTTTPRVSVVIPTYNNAAYIIEAIESVLDQSYSDYEIIVVDDGSTDDTHNVLRPYAHRLQYLAQDNRGAAAARNCGIHAAKGDLIAFLDADDLFLLPDKLERQVACFDSEPSLGVIQTGWRVINQHGETLSEVKPWLMMPDLDRVSWVKCHIVLPSTMMIRRSWMERLEGFDANLSPAEDLDLILRLTLMGCAAAWLPAVAVGYRHHKASATGNALAQVRAHEATLNKFFATPGLPSEIIQVEHHVRYYHLVWMAWRLFYTERYVDMARYLGKSMSYTPFNNPDDTKANWIEIFAGEAEALNRRLVAQDLDIIERWLQTLSEADAGCGLHST